MPAGSEPRGQVRTPDLPRTWRPIGAILATIFLGGALIVLCAVVWYSLDPGDRAQFTYFQRGTLIVLMVMFFACYHATVRSRVVATDDGRRSSTATAPGSSSGRRWSASAWDAALPGAPSTSPTAARPR